MSSSTTHAYTQLNPEHDHDSITTDDEHEHELEQQQRSRWYRVSRGFKEFRERNTGLLLIVASQIFFTFMNLSAKTLNGIDTPISPLQLVLVRMGITYICSITYMLATGVPDPFIGPKGVRLLLVFRGSSGFFGMLGIYFSLQYLSLSDATVLTFLSPLCSALSGALFLGEKLSYRQAVAGLFSLFGVILIARPPFLFGHGGDSATIPHLGEGLRLLQEVSAEKRMLAVFVALIGVLGATGAYTALRAIGKRAHPLHALVMFSSQSVVVATIGMVITKQPFIIPTQVTWIAVLFIFGIFGFAAQVLLTMGLAREAVGRGSMAIYSQIVFATIFERIFFHTSPTLLSIFGTSLIISSALFVALMKGDSGKGADLKDPQDQDQDSSFSTTAPSRVDIEEGMGRGLLSESKHRKYGVSI